MRTKCPVCGHANWDIHWTLEYWVPDGWTLPEKNTIRYCWTCGLIWYDNDRTQADYDQYYRERYGWASGHDKESNLRRLDALADLVAGQAVASSVIVDFGGDPYFVHLMRERGFENTYLVGVDDELPQNVDCCVLSMVLEHIYDLHGLMQRLVKCMNHSRDTLFVVAVPNAEMMGVNSKTPLSDYHQKHINHFSHLSLELLFRRYGYHLSAFEEPYIDHSYPEIYNAVYWQSAGRNTYKSLKAQIGVEIEEKVNKLSQVKGPVIVWGCGDLCMHLLTQVELDIVHFVDMDPAFQGATIHGIPVYQRPLTRAPIVVMVQGQLDSIRASIRKMGIENDVIVI